MKKILLSAFAIIAMSATSAMASPETTKLKTSFEPIAVNAGEISDQKLSQKAIDTIIAVTQPIEADAVQDTHVPQSYRALDVDGDTLVNGKLTPKAIDAVIAATKSDGKISVKHLNSAPSQNKSEMN